MLLNDELGPITDARRERMRLENRRGMHDAVIGQALTTDEGMVILAQAMTEPLLITVQVRSNLRKVLAEQELDFHFSRNVVDEQIPVGARYLSWDENRTPVLSDEPFQIDLRFAIGIDTTDEQWCQINDAQYLIGSQMVATEDDILRRLVMVLPAVHMDDFDFRSWDDVDGLIDAGIISAHNCRIPTEFGFERRDDDAQAVLGGREGVIAGISVFDMGIEGIVVFPQHLGRLYHHHSPNIHLERSGDDTILMVVREHLVVAIENHTSILRIHR